MFHKFVVLRHEMWFFIQRLEIYLIFEFRTFHDSDPQFIKTLTSFLRQNAVPAKGLEQVVGCAIRLAHWLADDGVAKAYSLGTKEA